MLKSLKIKNFQSHRDTILEFVEGVNVIFGQSLSGKTGMLRGFNLALDNRPSGPKFYSNFASEKGSTEIEIVLAEGNKISLEKIIHRKKDKTKNLDDTIYRFNTKEFSGTNRDVPDEIVQAFNMSELNIQKQFDQPFLITGSGGEFARTVNRVTKLDKPDEWVSELTRRINETNRETKLLESQAKDTENEIAKYHGYEELIKQNDQLIILSSELQLIENKEKEIDLCLERIEEIDAVLKRIKPALDLDKDISVLFDLDKNIQLLERRFQLVSRIGSISSLITELQAVLDASQDVAEGLKLIEEVEDLTFAVKQIEAKDDKIKKLNSLLSDMKTIQLSLEIQDDFAVLKKIIEKIESNGREIENKKKTLLEWKTQYIIILKEDKTCPTCFSKIDEQTIKRVEDSI